jgi:Ca2+-binding EF-hand superfamily protein
MAADWKKIHDKLPTEKTPEGRAKRLELFKLFDPNGNGYLSLAEVDKGMHDIIQLHEIFDCKPVMMRAFQAAKTANVKRSKPGTHGADYIDRTEFRVLFVYLRQYYELWVMFHEIDKNFDRRVSLDEFKKAVPKLKTWGVNITDPVKTFKEIDRDGGGMILFDEFAHWALLKGLDLPDDDDFDDEVLHKYGKKP